MATKTTETTLPHAVLRAIANYRSTLRAEITKAVIRKVELLGRDLRPDEIGETASEVIFGDGNYDRRMEQMCLEAVDQGKFRYLEDVIDELEKEEAAGPAAL